MGSVMFLEELQLGVSGRWTELKCGVSGMLKKVGGGNFN